MVSKGSPVMSLPMRHRSAATVKWPEGCPGYPAGGIMGQPMPQLSAGTHISGTEGTSADQITWRLHREVVLLAGWGRAILLQLAHPLVAQGVADHSAFAESTWARMARLRRTLSAMLALTFGTPDEAGAAAAAINRIHDRVNGRLAGAAAGLPAGSRYSAHDPALLTWVHATLVDTFLLTYERFVSPLTPDERDRYCVESSAIEPLLGIPDGTVPRSVRALERYLDGMFASGEIHVTEAARLLAAEILNPPFPPVIGRPLV